jgi:signal transduction histidine kinase
MSLKKIRQMRDSLIFRLTVVYALSFTLIAAAGFAVAYYRIYSITMEKMDEEFEMDVDGYAERIETEGLQAAVDKIYENIEDEDPREEFYRLLDGDNNVIATTDMTAWRMVERENVIQRLKANGRSFALQTIETPGGLIKARFITAAVGDNLFLQIGESLEEANEYLAIFRNLFIILTTALTLVTVFIGWRIARWAMTDINAVTATAEDITQGAYDRRVEIEGQVREVKRLSRTFNRMLDRIQNLMMSMREVNDSIAHDLRSPLARIRGIAEMTLTENKAISEYREMACSTIEECDGLIELINTMLDITETEAGVSLVNWQTFDIVAVLSEACELFGPLAVEKHIRLEKSFPDFQMIMGDRKRLQRIITNLLENAIKYTPNGGIVTITARKFEDSFNMSFNDTGIGIAESDLPRIYERFYRCDKSRPQGGFGLGLSLAKAYAESMNGVIQVTSALNQGSTFTLTLKQPVPA